jgi:hypothetical protein
VLTNSFPSSSRWVVSSNLSNPGRFSVSGVLSSCPSTAATTWYSFLRRATATMAAVSPPAGGGINDVFPTWGKNNIRVCPVASPADGGGGGATMAKQEAAPRRRSSESTAPTPQRGTRRATTSRLRRRRAPFPRNTPTPSRRTTPARSRGTSWVSLSYLRQRCSPPLARLRHRLSTKRYRPIPILCLWIQPRPTERPRFGGRFYKGMFKPSGVSYAVTLGPADGRLDLRTLRFRGR